MFLVLGILIYLNESNKKTGQVNKNKYNTHVFKKRKQI